MYLDYSKLAFDKNGTPETPTLVLKTMHEETIGVIPGVYNLKLSVKFAEPSEMTFDGSWPSLMARRTGFMTSLLDIRSSTPNTMVSTLL